MSKNVTIKDLKLFKKLQDRELEPRLIEISNEEGEEETVIPEGAHAINITTDDPGVEILFAPKYLTTDQITKLPFLDEWSELVEQYNISKLEPDTNLFILRVDNTSNYKIHLDPDIGFLKGYMTCISYNGNYGKDNATVDCAFYLDWYSGEEAPDVSEFDDVNINVWLEIIK